MSKSSLLLSFKKEGLFLDVSGGGGFRGAGVDCFAAKGRLAMTGGAGALCNDEGGWALCSDGGWDLLV
jgi:hypothetical protein